MDAFGWSDFIILNRKLISCVGRLCAVLLYITSNTTYRKLIGRPLQNSEVHIEAGQRETTSIIKRLDQVSFLLRAKDFGKIIGKRVPAGGTRNCE